MEIVRLVYCEHTCKGVYTLVNVENKHYWRKNISLNRHGLNEILPLYISSRDNRYLAFCMGVYEIEFKDNDL